MFTQNILGRPKKTFISIQAMNLNSSDHSCDLYKDESSALIKGRYKSKKSRLKRLGYWADLNYKEERTYRLG